MPTIRETVSIAAGGQNANVLQGSQFEFLARPSVVQVFAVQDAGDFGEIEVFFGQELQLPQSALSHRTAGEGPFVPDDEIVNDVGAPGDRLVVRLVETGGAAAAEIRVMVKITPA